MFTAAESIYGLDASTTLWAALMCDFEPAEISSFREFVIDELHLPIFSIEGCHMHYCSAIIKHIKDLGLGTVYKDANYRLKPFIAKLFAIAFLPAAMIVQVYIAIKDQLLTLLLEPTMI